MDDSKTYPVGHKEYTCKTCGKKTNLVCAFTGNCVECKELIDILFNKKFIKDGKHYPDTKVLLVKGGTKKE